MTDLSTLSNDELVNLYQKKQSISKSPSEMSDNELKAAYQAKQTPIQTTIGDALTSSITDIPSEAYRTTRDQAISASNNLPNKNDLSKENIPAWYDLGSAAKGALRTGQGILEAGTLAFAPAAGALNSLIGHPFSYLNEQADKINPNNTPGIGFTPKKGQSYYDAAKEQVNTALSATTPESGKIFTSTAPKAEIPNVKELKSSYNEGIKAAQDLGVEIPQKSLYRAQFDIKRKLLNPEDGGQPTDIQIAPKTLGVLENLGQYKNEVGNVKPTANLGDIENTRKVLNQLLLDQDPHEQAAASAAIKHLDDYINNLTPDRIKSGDINEAKPLLRNARGDYAAASRSQEVLNAAQKADEDAAITGNLETKTRSGLKKLYQNERKTLGFNESESKQLDTTFRGTKGGNIARGMASILAPPARNIVSSGASLGGLATIGGLLGGPVGAVALPVAGRGVGEVARLLGKRSTMKQVQKLDEMIRARSPRAKIIEALMGANR